MIFFIFIIIVILLYIFSKSNEINTWNDEDKKGNIGCLGSIVSIMAGCAGTIIGETIEIGSFDFARMRSGGGIIGLSSGLIIGYILVWSIIHILAKSNNNSKVDDENKDLVKTSEYLRNDSYIDVKIKRTIDISLSIIKIKTNISDSHTSILLYLIKLELKKYDIENSDSQLYSYLNEAIYPLNHSDHKEPIELIKNACKLLLSYPFDNPNEFVYETAIITIKDETPSYDMYSALRYVELALKLDKNIASYIREKYNVDYNIYSRVISHFNIEKWEKGELDFSQIGDCKPVAHSSIYTPQSGNTKIEQKIESEIKKNNKPELKLMNNLERVPGMFELSYKMSKHHSLGEVIEIFIKGIVIVPFDRFPATLVLKIVDCTERKEQFDPVKCDIQDFVNNYHGFLEMQDFVVPYEETKFQEINVLVVPLDGLKAVVSGARIFRLFGFIISQSDRYLIKEGKQGAEFFDIDFIEFRFNQIGYGFLEQDKEFADAIIDIVKLCYAITIADGSVTEVEIEKIDEFIVNRFSDINDKNTGNQIKAKVDSAFKSLVGNKIDTEPKTLAEEAIKHMLVFKNERLFLLTYEICVQVAVADNDFDAKEKELLDFIAIGLNISTKIQNEIKEKYIKLSMAKQVSDEDFFGITPNMTNEAKKEHLNKEFNKWRHRVTNNDKTIAAEATLRLEKIANLRQKLQSNGNKNNRTEINQVDDELKLTKDLSDEEVFGITSKMSREEVKEQLNKEYLKWHNFVASDNPKIVSNAKIMLDKIADLKYKLKFTDRSGREFGVYKISKEENELIIKRMKDRQNLFKNNEDPFIE